MKNLIAVAFFLLALCGSLCAQKEKISAEELIAKHTASIGTAEALAAVKSRVMVGVGAFTTKIKPGKIGGAAQLATEGDKFLLAMVLNANEYPYEKFGFDGKDLTTGNMPSGGPSPLGDVLRSNKLLVRRGLFLGVLSQAWPLLKTDSEIKLQSAGLSKVGDRKLYKMKVNAAGAGDMTISLYFEPETFRHVRTEYSARTGQLTTPNPNRPPVSGSNAYSPGSFTLTEDFSNFAKVDNLVLPLTYAIEYTTEAGRTMIWTINFSQAFNNQPIEASVFRVS